MRYAIIGTGVAGYACVEAIRSVDKNSEIIMFGDDPHGYYSRPGLAYYLTDELPDKALFPKKREQFAKLNFKYQISRVTKINRAEKKLVLDGNILSRQICRQTQFKLNLRQISFPEKICRLYQ